MKRMLILCSALILMTPALAAEGSQMDTLLASVQRASDNAAAATYPSDMLSSTWQAGDAAGEPYRWMTTGPGKPTRIVLYLHSWSGDEDQVTLFPDLLSIRNAIIIAPNFGGPNNTTDALGSPDSTDRIARVVKEIRYKTGLTRIYLIGASGGGMAALLLLGRYPDVVYRASIWVPIYDLAALYGETSNNDLKADMVTVLGSAPTDPDDTRYLGRSPRSALPDFNGSASKIIINVGALDTEVPKHHGYEAQAAMLAASPSADVTVIEWATMGHEFRALEAVKQIALE
ncbi:alpha/beta fold hydrolase [Rhizobium cremeum]|uniref:alpha/beta hydrolase family protein n=1 Tax=Rhizobium cremeum TaxID=2813827 RepID=UPI001FD1A6F3|nr:alpha/beta fold hydrolase [Rhizobium cremeum]MCJ7996049.1 alpha/beta fold hydrolase [Rhizobium cremeum]MCJ8001308.1 alpha/beta fold hydrolase [Rhizobium cremeum]